MDHQENPNSTVDSGIPRNPSIAEKVKENPSSMVDSGNPHNPSLAEKVKENPNSTVDSGIPHNPSIAEKVKEKAAVLKEKLTPGPHPTESADHGPGQKQSTVQTIKDKMQGLGHRASRDRLTAPGSGIGYEMMHSEEELNNAEHGHGLGEKIAHLMPGPPYFHRHQKKGNSEDD